MRKNTCDKNLFLSTCLKFFVLDRVSHVSEFVSRISFLGTCSNFVMCVCFSSAKKAVVLSADRMMIFREGLIVVRFAGDEREVGGVSSGMMRGLLWVGNSWLAAVLLCSWATFGALYFQQLANLLQKFPLSNVCMSVFLRLVTVSCSSPWFLGCAIPRTARIIQNSTAKRGGFCYYCEAM